MWDLPRLFPPKEALLKVSTHSQTKTQHCLDAVVRSLEATYEIREDLADALGRVGAFWDDSGEEPVVGAACHPPRVPLFDGQLLGSVGMSV